MKLLNEKTQVPLGIALGAIGGAGLWLGILTARVDVAVAAANTLSRRYDDQAEVLRKLTEKLGEIVGELKRINPH